MMTSAGNLVRPERFRGRDSVLSGPAGGIVALARLAKDAGATSAIGLDMGGTSTDVSRFEGKVGRRSESNVAGVRIMTPMMDIHTVAAGGGSICSLTDGRLMVGPDSAGAMPGPACYGRGGPLTITDVNLLLGRLPESKFPFRLDRKAALDRLTQIASEMDRLEFASQKSPPADHGKRWTQNLESLAEGFLDIAVTHMAEAIRTISTARGSDVREMTLVGFGGAAGTHVCRVAKQLGMKRILDHPDAGLMSALGMGIASVGTTITRGIYQAIDHICESEMIAVARECCSAAQSELQQDSVYSFELDVRYVGTESSLTVAWPAFAIDALDLDLVAVKRAFLDRHQAVFGYVQPDRAIEIVSMRCDATIPSGVQIHSDSRRSNRDSIPHQTKIWHGGEYIDVQVWDRNSISAGDRIDSPAMVISATSTLLVEPDWQVTVQDDGSIELIHSDNDSLSNRFANQKTSDDPVLMEVTARRLQGIADAMGERLRATAISVNIKERRDYSCAIFTADGSLVANAAHVPVHLGAMGHTVRQMMTQFPNMSDGDCYLTNDPMAGGSHLPDLTLVTPVFVNAGTGDAAPDFFVASRAHHAEIGGISPGSMPSGATCLAEEGVVIRNFALVQSGVSHSKRLRQQLQGGLYPSRNPDENLADLAAQAAAGVEGVKNLRQLATTIGSNTLSGLMNRLLDVAAEQTRRFVASQPDQPKRFVDSLDDGTKIGVTILKQNDRWRIAFDAVPVHPGGFNATPAIVTAATLYVLRCVSPSDLPLCDGVLRWIDLDIPTGMLNPPAHADPAKCAAVVAGNVETSQRIVDVLLGAMNAAAASQGTMNNFIVGDESFGYYETIGGGMGATRDGHGASGVHCHMTNTRITDPEIVETRLPIRLHRFEIRTGSGGNGKHRGGDGLIREFEFLKPLTVSLLTSRRTQGPYGIDGGGSGQPGRNWHRTDGRLYELPPNVTLQVQPHDRLVIETPGGGAWGTG
jgi:5-oxoprolinase (ATP-hydrolysing)